MHKLEEKGREAQSDGLAKGEKGRYSDVRVWCRKAT